LAAVGDLQRAQAARQALLARSRAERERQARAYLAAPGVLDDASRSALGEILQDGALFKLVAGPYVTALSVTASKARPTPLTAVAARARRWLGFPAALDAHMTGKLQFEGKSAAAAMAAAPRAFSQMRKVRRPPCSAKKPCHAVTLARRSSFESPTST